MGEAILIGMLVMALALVAEKIGHWFKVRRPTKRRLQRW